MNSHTGREPSGTCQASLAAVVFLRAKAKGPLGAAYPQALISGWVHTAGGLEGIAKRVWRQGCSVPHANTASSGNAASPVDTRPREEHGACVSQPSSQATYQTEGRMPLPTGPVGEHGLVGYN